ncbi:MAG: Asp-tRNA(Asn)/Glu-tRNA(Gln) amidotransferase subunit GatA [Clostridia bacterium]|nr:Asp-tRNA(Asn)/Glu-tRNA(Gln) amidotransferase subunit GatA [Clostridia bacterium]
MEYTSMTLKELSQLIHKREISSLELTENYIKKIKEKDHELGAFITVSEESAIKTASWIDEDILSSSSEKLHPLVGIPVAIKDNLCTEGIKTTCASRLLQNFVPPYSAEAVMKLKKHGAVIIGKTNMDEFGMGSSCENSAFGITKNPLDTARVPGGSSGGSAAAVASGLVPYALGSDTGGSIRQPASYCGVVGMKPSYGRVSRYGLIAFASSLDTVGPITRDVISNAAVYDAIAGHDPKDSTSMRGCAETVVDKIENGSVKGMRIGIPFSLIESHTDKKIKNAVMSAINLFSGMGCKIIDIELPDPALTLAAYYAISSAEASSNLARYDGIRFGTRAEDCLSIDELYKKSRSIGFGDEVKRRILLGTFLLSREMSDRYYKKALFTREAIKQDFDKLFSACDVIITPVSPGLPYHIGKYKTEPSARYSEDIFTVYASLAGLPAISMPVCKDASTGLQIGIEIIGRFREELTVYQSAYALENEIKNSERRCENDI